MSEALEEAYGVMREPLERAIEVAFQVDERLRQIRWGGALPVVCVQPEEARSVWWIYARTGGREAFYEARLAVLAQASQTQLAHIARNIERALSAGRSQAESENPAKASAP